MKSNFGALSPIGKSRGLEFMNLEKRFERVVVPIKAFMGRFNLPRYARNEMKVLYFKAMRRGLTRGRSFFRTLGCLLYYIAKEHNLPITAYEIAEEVDIDKYSLLKSYQKLRKDLDLPFQDFEAKCLVAKYANNLDLKPEEESQAYRIIEGIKRETWGPRVKVALALWKASERTQKEVAEVCGISKYSLRGKLS